MSLKYIRKKNGEKFGLRIDVDNLRDNIALNKPYNPEEIDIPFEFDRPGTTIVLSSLKHSRQILPLPLFVKG